MLKIFIKGFIKGGATGVLIYSSILNIFGMPGGIAGIVAAIINIFIILAIWISMD